MIFFSVFSRKWGELEVWCLSRASLSLKEQVCATQKNTALKMHTSLATLVQRLNVVVGKLTQTH